MSSTDNLSQLNDYSVHRHNVREAELKLIICLIMRLGLVPFSNGNSSQFAYQRNMKKADLSCKI